MLYQGIYSGEILSIVKPDTDSRNFLRYNVLVKFSNGSQVLVTNAESASMFGGIADYFQIVSRVSGTEGISSDKPADASYSRVGDRVLVAFLGGHIHAPIIVGYMQHPNQTNEFEEDQEKLKPQAIMQYLGLRFIVDEDGQFTIMHKGAPEVVDTSEGGALGAISGALGAAAGLLSGGGSTNPSLGADNPAVTPAEDTNLTLLEFLKDGVFRIRDADGQMIELDRTKGRMYFSNNDLKSTEDAEVGPASGGNQFGTSTTQAEYLWFDKETEMTLLHARKLVQVSSKDMLRLKAKGDLEGLVFGNNNWTISGDESFKIAGSKTDKVAGDWTSNIVGAVSIASKSGSLGLDALQDVTISSKTGNFSVSAAQGVSIASKLGGTLDLSAGVKLGNSTGDLLATIAEALGHIKDALIETGILTVGTGTGPSSTPANGPKIIELAAKIAVSQKLIEAIQGA